MTVPRRAVLVGLAGVPLAATASGRQEPFGREAAVGRPQAEPGAPFDLAWLQRHGRNQIDTLSAVEPLGTGGYAFVGHTVHAISEDIWIVRVTEDGRSEWSTAVLRSATARVFDAVEDLSGDLIGGGWYRTDGTESDVLMMRITGEGDLAAHETYDVGHRGAASRVVPVRPGNYALLGYVQAEDDGDVAALSLVARPDGSPVARTVHALDAAGTSFAGGARAADGGCLAVGHHRPGPDGDQEALVVALDPRGRRRWWRTLDGPADAWAEAVVSHPEGGYVIGGNAADDGPWLVALDEAGERRWRTSVGDADVRLRTMSVVGGVVLVGGLDPADSATAWVAAVGPSGDLRWSHTYGPEWLSSVVSMATTPDDGVVAAGNTLLGRNGQDGFLAKLLPPARDPVPDVSVTPWSPDPGEQVLLDGSGSTAPDGEIARYEWDLTGDGATDATGRFVEHRFDESGDHAVTLRVVDDHGRTGTTTLTVTVGTPTPDGTGIDVPGFGLGTAAAGLAGGMLVRLLRRRRQ